MSDFPIKTTDDVKRLTPRSFKVEREPVLAARDSLADVFGDVLPVLVGNFDHTDSALGNQPYVGNFIIGITASLFKLIGAEPMMLWPFDYPNVLAELLRFLVEDKKRFFNYLQTEGLICSNTDNQFAGPSCYGYVSALPEGEKEGTRLADVWGWSESQETEMMSPIMFEEYYLPYIAELANMFGLVYYGCCERIDHKLEAVLKAIPKIRSVSISGWTHVAAVTERIGSRYVASKKPIPAFVSSPTPDWDAVKKEALATRDAIKRDNCPIEVICRDVYSSKCTPQRAIEWVRIWKETLDFA